MKRHSRLSRRKDQQMNTARAQKLNPDTLRTYLIWTKKGVVLTLKEANYVHLDSHEHAENVTATACVSAMDAVIPAMISFIGKRYRKTFIR
ncbi:hypothetical protein PR048_019980 [Dryococelus australis]|uniref:Uncharacterized protein n=1 Tax=Dryococelus australis TaxID=614101 RepID=A0ABQ9H542_9NEOP|nr:hypothetical protein PR048_019980 [Dryococelus australis]